MRNKLSLKAVVAVDGVTQSGKTPIARALADGLGAMHLDLDDFLISDQRCYVEAIAQAPLSAALKAAEGITIISGVCVLEVLDRIGQPVDFHIYMKRLSGQRWADQTEVESDQLEQIADALGVPVTDYWLPLEVRAYHQARVPQRNADLVFEWVDGVGW